MWTPGKKGGLGWLKGDQVSRTMIWRVPLAGKGHCSKIRSLVNFDVQHNGCNRPS